jgi:hypothetical protein
MPAIKEFKVNTTTVKLKVGLTVCGIGPVFEFFKDDVGGAVNDIRYRTWRRRGLGVIFGSPGSLPGEQMIRVEKEVLGASGGVEMRTQSGEAQPVVSVTLPPGRDFPGGLRVRGTVADNGQPICRVDIPQQSGTLNIEVGSELGGDINIFPKPI